jgi:hypothetical protein
LERTLVPNNLIQHAPLQPVPGKRTRNPQKTGNIHVLHQAPLHGALVQSPLIKRTSGKNAFIECAGLKAGCRKGASQKADLVENRVDERTPLKHHMAKRAQGNTPIMEMVFLESTVCHLVMGMQHLLKPGILGGKQVGQTLPGRMFTLCCRWSAIARMRRNLSPARTLPGILPNNTATVLICFRPHPCRTYFIHAIGIYTTKPCNKGPVDSGRVGANLLGSGTHGPGSREPKGKELEM